MKKTLGLFVVALSFCFQIPAMADDSSCSDDNCIYYATIDDTNSLSPQTMIEGIGTEYSPALANFTLSVSVTNDDGTSGTQDVDTLALLFEDSQGSGLSVAFINPETTDDGPVYFSSPLPDANTTENPALTVQGNTIIAAFTNDDGDVFGSIATSDNLDWASTCGLFGPSYAGPAITTYNDQVWASYTDSKKDGLSEGVVTLGNNGNPNCTYQLKSGVSSSETKTSAALSDFNGTLYTAWKGYKSDKAIYLASMDASSGIWTTAKDPIPNASSSANPALVSFNGYLYAAWADDDTSGLMFSKMDSSGNWKGPYALSDSGASSGTGPSLAVLNGKLYVAWTEYQKTTDIEEIVSDVASAVATVAGLVLAAAAL